MRKEYKEPATVGELLAYLQDIPADTPIGRQTLGHFQINKLGGVGFFLGELTVGWPEKETSQVILRVSAG